MGLLVLFGVLGPAISSVGIYVVLAYIKYLDVLLGRPAPRISQTGEALFRYDRGRVTGYALPLSISLHPRVGPPVLAAGILAIEGALEIG
jgi:hypothetical protein